MVEYVYELEECEYKALMRLASDVKQMVLAHDSSDPIYIALSTYDLAKSLEKVRSVFPTEELEKYSIEEDNHDNFD